MLLAVFAGVTACRTTTPTREPVVRITPAAQKQSAQPTVSEARRLSGEADTQGALAAAQVSRVGNGLQETQREMQLLVETTRQLRQQKVVNENDLLQLYNRLVDQEKRMHVLVADISSAELSLASERSMRKLASVKLSEAETLITAKDAEAAQLRDQLTYMNDVAEAQKRMADDNAALVSKESARADRVAGESAFKGRLLIVTAGLLLLAVFIIILLVKTKLPI